MLKDGKGVTLPWKLGGKWALERRKGPEMPRNANNPASWKKERIRDGLAWTSCDFWGVP